MGWGARRRYEATTQDPESRSIQIDASDHHPTFTMARYDIWELQVRLSGAVVVRWGGLVGW